MNTFKLKTADNKTASLINSNSNMAFFKPLSVINQPNDVHEHEADQMADKVMRMPDKLMNQPAFFKPAAYHTVQRKCQACEEEDKFVRRKESNTAPQQSSNQLNNYISSLSSSGQRMPESSRKFFEPRFGHDFSNVRLHTDSVAAKSAQSINALAYTTGNNIVFNNGQYAPDSENGKKLMAHELTHVIQQQNGGSEGIQRMAACPTHLNDNDPVPPGFKNYFGNTRMFHCGFRTILEDRTPTPADPMNECVYDHSGVLVTDSHRYANCQGTPDQYDSATHPWDHTFNDSGGIWHAGGPAFGASMGYIKDRALDAIWDGMVWLGTNI